MLYGPHDSGKTTSLNHLIGLLDPHQQDWPHGKDREVLVAYQGTRVAVTTKGDGLKEVKGNLKFAEETGCDILVTAARTRGATRKKIRDYASKPSIKLIEVGAYIAPQFANLVNPVLAASLKKIMEGLIKEHL